MEREEGARKMMKPMPERYARQKMVKRTLLLLAAMLAALVLASGAALAINKACPSGTTQANPCSGTKYADILIGTGGADYIKGLAGDDKISGAAGEDTTNGGGGNDAYSYADGWGTDVLIDASGTDHLNFAAVGGSGQGVFANLIPEPGGNFANGPNGARLDLSSDTVVEKVTGSSTNDTIFTGAANNTLRPGPSAGGAYLGDLGGCSTCSPAIPSSNDTYTGLAAGGYGSVIVEDSGGTSDRLVLPFASTEAYFEAFNYPGVDGPPRHLLIVTSPTDKITILGQMGSMKSTYGNGHIERIQFTDKTLSIGGEAQTLGDASSAETQVAQLNDVSNLGSAEKEKLSEAF
jgi:Ca2+-binding RTX toxin-like protein